MRPCLEMVKFHEPEFPKRVLIWTKYNVTEASISLLVLVLAASLKSGYHDWMIDTTSISVKNRRIEFDQFQH